ncbi:uncharacterized protein LOC123988498 [Osmia bicornis bicornis]|uniref:uncharacterized protein LOC123988498 n=1 Tax=Osmia bicornis bicornis TaxID=1437191 RepID=UPI001EAEF1CC|nr:uncharacterized protein LOC123988498 [Osmia bicornis bicornis]
MVGQRQKEEQETIANERKESVDANRVNGPVGTGYILTKTSSPLHQQAKNLMSNQWQVGGCCFGYSIDQSSTETETETTAAYSCTPCPARSPRICVTSALSRPTEWKPCCIRKYNYPCTAHAKPRPLIRFTDFDLASQY